MMQVDLEKCSGCAGCLEVCPVEAISMVAGEAAIDVDTCLACGACVQACPQGAIAEIELPVPVTAAAVQLVRIETVRPAPVASSEGRLAWPSSGCGSR